MTRFLLLAALLAGGPAGAQQRPAYPAGRSEQEIEGLATTLLVPEPGSATSRASLIVLLHGAGDNGSNLSRGMTAWVDLGYLVCAPSSTGQVWSPADLERVLRIAAHLKKVMPIDPDRVHVMGFSNGGWNLAPLAFDDRLRPCSATWIAAGYNGGKVARWARKRLGCLALAGTEDPNHTAAEKTVDLLRGKVRSVECRLQPGLGHKWPRELMAYQRWWMGVQEGRFVPGEDENFAWKDGVEQALAELEGRKRGGVFVYYFSPADKDNPLAKRLQNEVFMDPLVRRFGTQLQAVKREFDPARNPYGVKTTPAVVVLKRDGSVKKLFVGKIKARSLASALRSVAPDRSMPKR